MLSILFALSVLRPNTLLCRNSVGNGRCYLFSDIAADLESGRGVFVEIEDDSILVGTQEFDWDSGYECVSVRRLYIVNN